MTQAVPTELLEAVVEVLGRALLAGTLGAGAALLHRWYARERIPEGLAVLVGLAGVALSLQVTALLGEVIQGDNLDSLGLTTALFNVGTLFVAGLAASAGARLGDRLGNSLFAVSGAKVVEEDVSRLVQTVGRVITIDLPEDIEDIEGYDPVAPGVKEKLAGRTLVFHRRLTVDQLRDALAARLKSDFGVGHVDVDLTEGGVVEYLAVGSRESGLGPTLPPETCAVAVRADPAFAASAGDLVQVWREGEGGPTRVAIAELRGTAGDVVTLAVDAADAELLDPDGPYRLVTLPVQPRTDREFASLLRAADETMGVVTVSPGSDLDGTTVESLDVSVVAVRPANSPADPIPRRSRTLGPGETVYAVARPDRLRKLEAAALSGPTGTDND
jgi:hypothetical protein